MQFLASVRKVDLEKMHPSPKYTAVAEFGAMPIGPNSGVENKRPRILSSRYVGTLRPIWRRKHSAAHKYAACHKTLCSYTRMGFCMEIPCKVATPLAVAACSTAGTQV